MKTQNGRIKIKSAKYTFEQEENMMWKKKYFAPKNTLYQSTL